MSTFNIETTYKTIIDSIWDNEKYQSVPFIHRGYAVQRDIPLGCILFIGINPSFSEKKTKVKERFFYSNHQQEEVHQYFKKFQDIAIKAKIEWSHLDLLYIRQTDQKIVKSIFNDSIGNEFLKKQLSISKAIIEKSKPKVIVVSNAYARDLFVGECKIETFFDDNLGTHKIVNNTALEGTPIFFTSMLTGQRALDNGSYDRLVWHINFVLNKIE
jgi:hypothetical protein